MIHLIRKSAFFIKIAVIVLLLTQIDISLAVFNPTSSTVFNQNLEGSSKSIDEIIQNIIAWLMGFLYVLAVLFGIYGGILILTAAGDEEKVKKGKTVIINVLIGLIIIFLVSTIINWVLDLFAANA